MSVEVTIESVVINQASAPAKGSDERYPGRATVSVNVKSGDNEFKFVYKNREFVSLDDMSEIVRKELTTFSENLIDAVKQPLL